MIAVLGILAISLIIVMIEVPTLLRKKQYRELWVFSILLLMGTGLSIVKIVHREIPNPFDLMVVLLQPLSHLLFGILE